MKPMTKAIAVALIQVLFVSSLGAKLLYDRRMQPRAWFRTQRYDPNLPIRGRYLSLQVEVNDPRTPEEIQQKFGGETQLFKQQPFYAFGRECGAIGLRNGVPIAHFENRTDFDCDNLGFERWSSNGQTVLRLDEPLLFFISDTAKDPTRLAPGEQLWVLATIPRHGPPRPISLGIKKAGESNIYTLDLN